MLRMGKSARIDVSAHLKLPQLGAQLRSGLRGDTRTHTHTRTRRTHHQHIQHQQTERPWWPASLLGQHQKQKPSVVVCSCNWDQNQMPTRSFSCAITPAIAAGLAVMSGVSCSPNSPHSCDNTSTACCSLPGACVLLLHTPSSACRAVRSCCSAAYEEDTALPLTPPPALVDALADAGAAAAPRCAGCCCCCCRGCCCNVMLLGRLLLEVVAVFEAARSVASSCVAPAPVCVCESTTCSKYTHTHTLQSRGVVA